MEKQVKIINNFKSRRKYKKRIKKGSRIWKKERKVNNLKVKLRRINAIVLIVIKNLFKNKFIKFICSSIIICVLVVAGRYFLFSKKFNISILNITGCRNIDENFIKSRLERVIGKNIFFIRSSNLRNEIRGYSPYIKNVKAEKHLPNIVDISIEERKPEIIWLNLSGSYLVDEEGFIVEVVSDFEDLKVSEEDIDLLKGYGNLKEYGKDENIDEEDNSSTNNEESEKQSETEEKASEEEDAYKLFEQNKLEVISRVDQYWNENLKNIPEEYKKFPFIYSYEQHSYIPLNKLDKNIVDSSKIVLSIDFVDNNVKRYIWESEYRFVIYYDLNHKVVFSTKRDFQIQIEDLKILINSLKKDGRNFSYIDLSSDIIVYEIDK